jgi:hypothetical protein
MVLLMSRSQIHSDWSYIFDFISNLWELSIQIKDKLHLCFNKFVLLLNLSKIYLDCSYRFDIVSNSHEAFIHKLHLCFNNFVLLMNPSPIHLDCSCRFDIIINTLEYFIWIRDKLHLCFNNFRVIVEFVSNSTTLLMQIWENITCSLIISCYVVIGFISYLSKIIHVIFSC